MDDQPPSPRKKILIIRFSAVGDIVLTSPVIRAIKEQIPNVEVHYLVKKEYASIIEVNPYVDKIHTFFGDLKATINQLRDEKFDFIVDLQKNLRSRKIIRSLHISYGTFPKHNIQKWIYVNLKINFLPSIHIVDRYFAATEKLNVFNDGKGLDFFIPEEREYDEDDLPAVFENGFVAISLGSIHATKRPPTHKIVEIAKILHKPVMLLGGKDVIQEGEDIAIKLGEKAYNGCGKFSLFHSASIIQKADCLLTGDTGLMHIAAAFDVPIAVLWGNTLPEFGMYPYRPNKTENYRNFETVALPCRPCSKLGYSKCPLRHFKCMNQISVVDVAEWINRF
ncbi:MAG TPA: glycosyltransferase family 9 protein [Bacteroidales bacterium]|nr:glycosyltransferase family 9 protein [Bacteroidales bacterium]